MGVGMVVGWVLGEGKEAVGVMGRDGQRKRMREL